LEGRKTEPWISYEQDKVGNAPALLLKQTDRTFQVDRFPEDDGGYYQVESTGAVALILEGSVSHLAEAVKEYGTGQGILDFSFVQYPSSEAQD
jgi:hypothetical protein